MDATRFDHLSRVLAAHGHRRAVLRFLTALPLASGLGALLGEEGAEGQGNGAGVGGGGGRRRRRGARHRPGQATGKRKRKPADKHHQHPSPRPVPGCTPTTCAAQGKPCGTILDGCGTSLDCGPCTCATGCHPVCQRCNPETNACDSIANDVPCDDGDACTLADTCQRGVCVGSNPVICPNPDQCHDPGVCNPATGDCSTPNKADGTRCGDACTEACTNGTCGPSTPMVCQPGESCHNSVCVCDDATSGLCCLPDTANLQAAINGAASGATLTLCAGTWTLSSTVVISESLILVGAGADATAIDGNHAVTVLRIDETTVTLQDLTIRNGADDGGGGIYNFYGRLTLRGVTVTGNSGGFGGGISNYVGQLLLQEGTSVTDNNAGTGGGFYNEMATITLEAGSSVTGNTAGSGGGFYNFYGGELTLAAGSSVTGNTAWNEGGGIYNEEGGRVHLANSAIVVNNCWDNCSGFTAVDGCAPPPPPEFCAS